MERPPNSRFRWLAWLSSAFLLISPFALSAGLQSSPQRQANQEPTNQDAIRINVELVVLHATVLNSNHQPVPGLGKQDFQIYEDGVAQEVESFSHEDVPVTVGMVIDDSGSMRPKRDEVIAAAIAFARLSNEKDQLFLVNFNEQVTFALRPTMPFTNDLAQMEFALSKLKTEGKTALHDAVAAALEHVKKGSRDKQVLIVISDGADNASRLDATRIIALAKQSEAIIYTIGIFERDDPNRKPGSLKPLAKATGGEAFLPNSISEVTAICERIAREVRTQYTLTYTPTNVKRDGSYRTIRVKAREGRENLLVRTRAGYYSPASP